MVFGFDPRKLVKDKQEEEEKKVETAIERQERLDKMAEETEAALRKQSKIKKALDKADEAIREVKFAEKFGLDKWKSWKEKADPEGYEKWEEWQDNTVLGKILKKSKTVEQEYGDKEEIKPQLASYESSGTTGLLKTESSEDPFSGEIGQLESITHGIISGAIKIPYGFANLGAMIMDLAADENLPVDQSKVAQLDRWFEQTYFGNVMKFSGAKAKENALGRLTEVIVQMYGGWKTVGTQGVKVTEKAMGMLDKAYDALKNGKYVKTTKNSNLTRGIKEVKKFNKLSGKQKFVSVAVGGGLAGAVVYDEENIGTFGDLFFDEGELTALDRKKKATSKEDATRMLYNKLKFGGEMGFPIIPAIWGLGKVGKSIVSGTMKRAANATKFDKIIEKYVARPMRARGPYPEEQFQAMQRLKGKSESSNLLSQDFLKNLDQIIKRISKNSQVASNASGLTDGISKAIVKVINSGKFGVKGNKISVRGFDKKSLETFYKSMDKLKIPTKEIDNIVREMSNVHGYWSQYLNHIVKGKNLNVSLKEFANLINQRIGDSLATEYKIFKDSGLSPIDGYVVSREIKDEVAKIFQRNAAANKVKMSIDDARLTVDQIIKNVKLDPTTGQPVFKFQAKGFDADKALITKSIAKNITGGGKFVADKTGELIQKESDLLAFQKLFGSYKNAMNVIANVTTDLSEIAARDRFYNVIKTGAAEQIARGERAMVYPTYNQAAKAWQGTGQKIIEAADGLKLPAKLGEEAYTVPINGMFTTETIAQGLIHGAANQLGSITKNIYYQAAVMVPKGLVQMGKTVGGPFTHARNFSSGAVTTVALGNIRFALTNPGVFTKALWRSLNTVQPQILWRNRPGINYTAGHTVSAEELKKGGQALYRFLLDEGMVNQSAIYRDVIGLIEDTQKIGFLQNIWAKLGRRTKGFLKAAQDMYVAEDDIWKVTNFLLEDEKIQRAYQAALKKGLITADKIPTDIEIMKMATQKVREMLPNYAYVNEIVQASRRSPLGNFVSWSAEIVRTTTNIAAGAKKEIANPIFRQMGWERAVGLGLTYATIGPLAVWGGQKLYGMSKDQLYAIKEFLPWFSEESTVIPVYEDGKYKYIDFSRAFFYDVVTNPLQSIITKMEQNADDPVIPGLAKGMVAGFARFIEPFVAESIWIGGVLDIYSRGGKTRRGQQIWNDRDAEGDKIWKTFKHLTRLYSPGSNIQMERLYKAITGKTIKGTQYEVSDELLGLVGLRKAPLNLERSLEIKIGEFLKAERDERKLIYAGTLTGDPVEDNNKILKQYIFANEQRLETFNKMKRIYDAAKTLQVPEKVIKEIFERRPDIYKMIKKNKFKPFGITEGMEDAYEKLSKRYNIPNPLTRSLKREIKKLKRKLKKQKLNESYILEHEEKYLFPDKKDQPKIEGLLQTQTPPLQQTPMPVVNQVQMAQKNPISNLTRTEEALLSPSEKIIAART